jgi:hypothetical protein
MCLPLASPSLCHIDGAHKLNRRKKCSRELNDAACSAAAGCSTWSSSCPHAPWHNWRPRRRRRRPTAPCHPDIVRWRLHPLGAELPGGRSFGTAAASIVAPTKEFLPGGPNHGPSWQRVPEQDTQRPDFQLTSAAAPNLECQQGWWFPVAPGTLSRMPHAHDRCRPVRSRR